MYRTIKGGEKMPKKMLCAIISIFILATTPITAYANSARTVLASPGLSFEDGIATCSVMITANYSDDVIRAVVRLCYEGDSIKVWYTSSDDGILAFERTYDIGEYGTGSYEITVDFTINGESYPRVSFDTEYQGG